MSIVSQRDYKYYKDKDVWEKINILLAQNAAIEASIGIDSSRKEYAKAKLLQRDIFLKIKELDEEFYNDNCREI